MSPSYDNSPTVCLAGAHSVPHRLNTWLRAGQTIWGMGP